IPSVVSTERILFPRIAPQEMKKPSLSSVKRFMERKDPRSKIQDPGKNLAPSAKPFGHRTRWLSSVLGPHGQNSEKHQASSSNSSRSELEFGSWIFPGSWILDLGSSSRAIWPPQVQRLPSLPPFPPAPH